MRIGDLDVPGHNLLVTATLRIKSKDLSGDTSATTRAHLGYQPKTLSVSTRIKFDDADTLTRLIALAEALDSTQKPKVYNVVDRTAQAMNMRQVQFNESFRAREDEALQVWNVSFELIEYRSVPEKIEQQQTTATAQTQQANGTAVASSSTTGTEKSTGFEGVLSYIDKILAPATGS